MRSHLVDLIVNLDCSGGISLIGNGGTAGLPVC